MHKPKLKRNNSTVQQKPFYIMKRLLNQENNKVVRFKLIFNKKKMNEYQLEANIQFNLKVFTQCQQLIPGHNLHYIKEHKRTDDNDLNLYIKPYQCRLDSYVLNKQINQQKSIEIMKEVIEALYCLYKSNYICVNIRAENFVRVQIPNSSGNLGEQKKYRWKLWSVPYGYSYPSKNFELKTPYTWNDQYQPPEAYTRKLSQEELKQSLVWSIGCLWLQILYGKNVLNNMQNIKKFCVGSGKYGVHNVESLQLKKKLSANNQLLLSKMLDNSPKNRITLKSIFQHKILGEIINIFLKDSQISKDSSIGSAPSLINEQQLKFNKYANINQFIVELIKIIQQQNLVPVYQQNSAIKKVLKKIEPKRLQQLKISEYAPKQVKKSKCKSQILDAHGNPSSFTPQNLQKYIKPYKFYYDKTIFLSNCSVAITKKLQEVLKIQKRAADYSTISSPQSYDQIFTFQFAIISMRLVYLQTLHQNLRLYQNVFSIPDTTLNIQNFNINNTKTQWQIFSQTALYQSLKLFISIKLNDCQKQLQALLQNQNLLTKRVSVACRDKITNVFKNMDYKVCPISKFLQYFQKVINDTIAIVDQFNVTKQGQKFPMNDKHGHWQQNMRYIGYLWISIFIQSQKLFAQTYYKQLFGKFMAHEQTKQTQPSFFKIKFLPMLNSRPDLAKRQTLYTSERSDEIFDFKNYQYFLRSAPSKKVTDQVEKLINTFWLS